MTPALRNAVATAGAEARRTNIEPTASGASQRT